MKPVVVLGDGAWGTALGLVAARAGRGVAIWGKFPDYVRKARARRENFRFLPGIRIPRGVELVSGAPPAADFYIAAVPTQFIRETFTELRPLLNRRATFVCVAKGLEHSTGKRPTQVLREVLGRIRVVVLSGPSHAPEVARGLPASVVAAGPAAATRRVQKLLSGDSLRVYSSRDALGVELGGALKNVIALAGGICEGLGLGYNAKAALLSRGIAEMARLGVKMGARRETFFGLSGIGDLITTTTFPAGRNLSVGRALGEGRTLRQVLSGMKSVAEGVWTTKAVRALARNKRVEMPITEQIHAILFANRSPRAALKALMRRGPRAEKD